jgi:hypothetical protein
MEDRGALVLPSPEVARHRRLEREFVERYLRERPAEQAALRPEIIGYDRAGNPIPKLGGAADYYFVTPAPPFNSSVGANFNTFTTFKDVSPTPLPIIFANQLRPGSGIKIEAEGEFSTTVTPTLQFGVIYGAVAGAAGGVQLALSSAITTASTVTSIPWHLFYRGLVTAVGATGSITGQGTLTLASSLTVFNTPVPMPITAALRTVAIDTTVSKLIGIGAAWSASSASNNVKVNNVSVLFLN